MSSKRGVSRTSTRHVEDPLLILLFMALFFLVFIVPFTTFDEFLGNIVIDTGPQVLPFVSDEQVPYVQDGVTEETLQKEGFSGIIHYRYGEPMLKEFSNEHGRVEFVLPMAIGDLYSYDFGKHIVLEHNRVFVDGRYGRLKLFRDAPATITLHGVPYYEGSSRILRYLDDEGIEECVDCTLLSYGVSSEGVWWVRFTVPGFTGYGVSNPAAPGQDSAELNSTTLLNVTTEDLICYALGTVDPDADTVVTQYQFIVNGTNFTLVAHSFDINTSGVTVGAVKDFSGNEHNATLGGGNLAQSPQWVGLEGGQVGGAYLFDGVDDHIDLDGGAFSLAPETTLEAWVNVSSNGVYSVVLGVGDATLGYALGINDGSGNLFFAARNGSTPGDLFTVLYPTSTLQLNAYHHLAGVYNQSTDLLFLYVDGVLVNTSAGPDSASAITSGVTFGADTGGDVLNIGSAGYFNGTLDQVMIYNHSLSGEQIAQHTTLNYNTLDDKETRKGYEWECVVIPVDGFYIGGSNQSNILQIVNTLPTHSSPTLISFSGFVEDSDDLTCINQNTQDADTDDVLNLYLFTLNNAEIDVVYLPFEDHLNSDTVAIDYSSHSLNGTVNGAVFNGSGGKLGGGYEFDGVNDFIEVGNNESLDLTTNVSIELWVRFDTFDNHTPLVMRRSDDPLVNVTNYGLRTGGNLTNSSDNELEFFFTTGDTQVNAWTTIGSNLVVGEFYHVVAAKLGGNNPSIYINGSLVSGSCTLGSCANIIEENNESLKIGKGIAEDTEKFFDGLLDDVRISRLALTVGAAKSHFNLSYQVLDGGLTTPGDQWSCAIVPHDGEESGQQLSSNTLTVIEDPSGTSGGGGGGSQPSPFVWDLNKEDSVVYTFQPLWEMNIVNFSQKVKYEVTVVSIEYYISKVTLDIYPNIGSFVVYNATSYLDLDLDGSYDITVESSGFAYETVTLSFEKYGVVNYSGPGSLGSGSNASGGSGDVYSPSFEIPKPLTPPIVIVRETFEEEEKEEKSYSWLYIVALLILIFVTLIFFLKKIRAS